MPHPVSIRLSPAELEALDRALVARRRRTGANATKADALREGLAAFCAAEGVEWPQPKKERAP